MSAAIDVTNPITNANTKSLIGAIDQGTSSSRFLVFSTITGEVVTYHQVEVKKIYPNEGWVEQDPNDIYGSVVECLEVVLNQKLPDIGFSASDILCIGLTNQRESTILWDKVTGEPLYNSIVWLDNRTSELVDTVIDHVPGRDINWLKAKTGLPISTYFSALKIKWLIETVPKVQKALKDDRVLFGTVDTWLLWKLTSGEKHLTDVTNASRTLLMDLETLDWDPYLCQFFRIPRSILPTIQPSASHFGTIVNGPLAGIPITGVIGDQNAALVGQRCLKLGLTKVTYGTGAFLMQNIGLGPLHGALKAVPKEARRKLLTTVAYKLGDTPACYALEGSIAIAGAAITWLRDNLELIHHYSEVEQLATTDTSARGLFFVPAFQGLYAPYWDANATGTIIGISQFSHKCHLVRATLEGVAFQTNDIIALMRATDEVSAGNGKHGVRVDGGMSSNDLLCQILADITGGRILRPKMTESTAMGAAMIAGYQYGLWEQFGRQSKVKSTQSTSRKTSTASNGNIENTNHPHQDQNNSAFALQNGKKISINDSDVMLVPTYHLIGNDHPPTVADKLISVASIVRYFFTSLITSMERSCDDDEERHQHNPVDVPEELDDEELDVFHPRLEENVRLERINTWRAAVSRSRKWIRIERQEQKRADYFRWSLVPVTCYVLASFAMHITSQGLTN